MPAAKTTRQARSDSAAAAIEAAKNATLPDLMPPSHVQISANAMPYYLDVVRARAREEWNPHQLTVAAQLAECMAEQVEVRAVIAVEGWTVTNAKGTVVPNPHVSISEQLARRQMALGRSLQMIGRAIGDPRAPLNKRKNEKTARELAKEVADEDEDLLA